MHRLYDYLASGNGYKVRLILRLLGIPFERVEVDIVRGESRTAEFLAKTPEGRIPVLRLDDGTHLSNRTPSSATWPRRRPTFPKGGSPARRRCSGCSGSNTATSRTWRPCATG